MQRNPSVDPTEADYGDAAAPDQGVNLRHYWYVFLERRWLIVGVLFLTAVAVGAYLHFAPRVYRAVATIQINPEGMTSLNLGDGSGLVSAQAQQDYLQTQYKLLLSRSLLEMVVKKQRLDQDPRYAGNPNTSGAVANDIKVAPVRMTRLVNVGVEHTKPDKAALIANTLIDEYIDANAALRQQRTVDTLMFLRAQALGLESEVAKAEEELQNYRLKVKFVSLQEGDNTIKDSLSQAQARYTEEKARSQTAQMTVVELDKHLDAGKPLEAYPAIATDTQVRDLASQLTTAENDLAVLLKRYKEKHPTIIQIRSKIDETRRAVQAVSQKAADMMRTAAKLAQANELTLVTNVQYWEDRKTEWNQAKMNYDVLVRKAETSKSLYNTVLTKMKEIEIVQREKSNNIWVVDRAVSPTEPVKPNVLFTIAAGGLAGLVIAFGLALFVSFLDDTIKSQDDVETYLRQPFLGYIPNVKSNSVVERLQHAHLQPQSNSSESFRTLRAAITLGGRGDKLKLITVTSTVPAEGKSTVACNLAIVMAQTGLKTLLVDADLRRPNIHQGFKMSASAGLTAYLMDKTGSLDELVQPSEVPNLDVVCCGSTPSQPSELLSSRRMATFIQEATARYERIIIDCPPVSAVSDPLIISSFADGVVMVTKFNKVRRDIARKSLQRMLEAGLQLCGVVINDIDFEGRDAYYYSYYYYQNRYYKGYYHQQRSAVAAVPEERKAEKTSVES